MQTSVDCVSLYNHTWQVPPGDSQIGEWWITPGERGERLPPLPPLSGGGPGFMEISTGRRNMSTILTYT